MCRIRTISRLERELNRSWDEKTRKTDNGKEHAMDVLLGAEYEYCVRTYLFFSFCKHNKDKSTHFSRRNLKNLGDSRRCNIVKVMCYVTRA